MVSRQTREIGVRIAIGALSLNILILVLKRGFTIVGLGIVIGLLTAIALSGFLAGLLYGVGSNDPITIGFSILILCLAALVACLLPALRAVRINPVTALREQPSRTQAKPQRKDQIRNSRERTGQLVVTV